MVTKELEEDIWIFKPYYFTISKIAEMTLPRKTHGMVCSKGSVYFIGGFYKDSPMCDIETMNISTRENI